MQEIMIKSHLIVKETHDEYNIQWVGKIIDAKPKFKNGKPIFAITGGNGRIELNTTDMAYIEKCAKLCTKPRGRSAVTTDAARIYLIEEDDNERLMGILTHDHVKKFAPMYDPIYYR
jgi:hypothetical protein